MTKTIILSDGISKDMTFEEVLKQFTPMIEKFAYQAIEKIIFNKPEKEEVLQELHIQTWEAYRRYNGKNAFSTYLVPRLQHGVHRATMKLYAQKRTQKGKFYSIDEVITGEDGDGNGAFLGNILGEDDMEMTSLPFQELLEHLDETLEPCEKIMLKSLMNKTDFSIRDLAETLGISRQGANKKYNKFREKIACILRETGYVTC